MKDYTPFHKILHLDISRNTKSWHPVIRNGWYVKFSIYRSNILLIFISTLTNQTIIRSYGDEDEACEFINFITAQDPSQDVA